MAALGKWLNRPRKRSQSSPTRQILSDFLNRPAPEPHQSHHQGYSSLPTYTGYQNNNTSTPMLITSSFYNLAYPFDQNDSSPGEDEPVIPVSERIAQYHTTSKPLMPSSSADNITKPQYQLGSNNKQELQPKTILYVHNRTPTPLSEQPHPLQLVETPKDYFGTGADSLETFDEYHQQKPFTWTRPELVPVQPKRKPTPYANHTPFDFEEERDDHQASSDPPSKAFTGSPTGYNAEFEKLRTEIKKLEKTQKKHKQRELRMHQQMLDTQQQLEYLILSRSYESNRPYSYHNHDSTLWNQYMNRKNNDTAPSSSNSNHYPSQQPLDTGYWYGSYGYFFDQSPYPHQPYDYPYLTEPEDYYTDSNEYMAASLPSNFTSSAAIPISYQHNQSSKSLDSYYPNYGFPDTLDSENERNYCFHHRPAMYHYDYFQHNEMNDETNSRPTMIPKNNSKNKKRWTQ